MNTRILVFLAAVAAAAAAYVVLAPTHPRDRLAQSERPAPRAPSPGSRDFAIAPAHRNAPPAPPVRKAAVPAHPSLSNEYLRARSYRALYDRLRNSPEARTAEGLYVTYEILRKCATVSDRPWRHPQPKAVEQRRQEFLAALPPDDPQHDKRVAAFEAVAVDRCAGFEGVTVSQADLDQLLASAAGAGDPKAKAARVQQEIWQERRAGQWRTASLSDSQISTLEQAIGSRDPEAMVVAGRLLSNSWHDLTVRIGPDGEAIEPRAFYNAWQVLACEYGYPCAADNQRLLDECAYNGHCDATSLPDYLYYYASSPHETELLTRYETVLRGAIENGDWSQLTVTRGPRMPASRYPFGHGSG